MAAGASARRLSGEGWRLNPPPPPVSRDRSGIDDVIANLDGDEVAPHLDSLAMQRRKDLPDHVPVIEKQLDLTD